MKHKGIFITLAVVTAVAAVYAGVTYYYGSHLLPGSKVLGVKADGADVSRIEDILKDNAAGYSLDIKGDSTEDTLYGSEVSLSLDADSLADAAKQILSEQKPDTWPKAFFRANVELEVPPLSASFDDEALDEALDSLNAVTETPVASENATYELSGDSYTIVDEVYGTEIKMSALKKQVEAALKTLSPELDLRESGCYRQPKVKSTDKKLRKLVKTLNKYLGTDITYDFGDKGKVMVPKDEQAAWLSVGKDDKVTLDHDAIYRYVQTSLGYKYNTMGLDRKLKTQYGKTVTVKGGNYGWWVNYDAEVAQIEKDLKAGKDVTREPVYRSKAANHGDYHYDYGDSYAEVNIFSQHMFLVIDGKVVLDSDVVTGKPTEDRNTPTGTYSITYKTRDATLRGENYASDVSYWMPFNGNIGFHDAPWRYGRFGGNIYKTNGSHGCVNLPPATAKALYPYVEKGFPVIVYYQEVTDEQREEAETGFTEDKSTIEKKEESDTKKSSEDSKSSDKKKSSKEKKKSDKKKSDSSKTDSSKKSDSDKSADSEESSE